MTRTGCERIGRWIAVSVVVWALVRVGVCAAATPVIPADAVAYWRFDPSRFGGAAADPAALAQRRVVLAGMRAAVASGLVGESRAAGALDALLAAAEVGARPHTLCLLDLDGHRRGDGQGLAPEVLRFALAVESSGDHAALLRTLRAILIGGDAQAVAGAQQEIVLPGSVRGVRYREPGWSPWREVQWASTADSFVIGFGAGSLERWFSAQASGPPDDAPWAPHRLAVERQRQTGDVFFEAYLGLDQARRGFPWGFRGGRVRRVLETLGLSNARDVMIHGRWIEPAGAAPGPALIALDVTYSARSERPGVVRRVAVSEDRWPEDLRIEPPPGTYAVVMRAPWGAWITTALDLVWAASSADHADAKRAAIRAWLRGPGGQALTRLIASVEPWAVVSDVPAPIAPIPGASTLFVPIKPGVSASAFEDLLRRTLADHRDRLQVQDGVWSFKVDPGGVLRIPSWGVVGRAAAPVFVGGWGPPVVIENRARLGDPRSAPGE